jgi:hypothetical protein
MLTEPLNKCRVIAAASLASPRSGKDYAWGFDDRARELSSAVSVNHQKN